MKRSRRLLSITIVFFWASEYCHAPYFTPYLQSLGFAASLIGIMTGMYGFSQTLVRIPLGIITDVTGCYKKTILMGTIFTTISSFGLIFATHPASIIICRILAGVAASSWLAFTILYAAYFDADESVQATTNINAFNSIGKLLAFVLGMITASLWGYKYPLICSFLTGVIAILCAVQLKPIQLKREPFQFSHVAAVFSNPAVLCAAFFAIIMQAFQQGTVFSFTSTVARELGASPFEIGMNTVLFTLIQVVAAGFMGRKVLKKLTSCQSITIGFILMTICCLLVAFADNIWYIYASQTIGGISNIMTSSILMSMIIRYVPQENQSTAMGLYQALYGIGMTLGPVMTGQLANRAGYSVAYLVMGAMTLGTALLVPILFKRYVNRAKPVS